MSDIIYEAIKKRIKVFFEFADAFLYIHPSQKDFWEYLHLEMPDKPVLLSDVLFELVGMEDQIKQIAQGKEKNLIIPTIQREFGDQSTHIYFDLEIVYCNRGNYPLVIILEDRTRIFLYQQKLVQSRNETQLLQRKLVEKNKRLKIATKRLSQMKEDLIRKNDELEKLNRIIQRQNIDLEERVRERTKELQSARIEIIRRLAQAAEYRDPETGSHILRMSRTCVLIAQTVGLDEKQCDLIFHGGSMHDLGKIAIPDSILLKPGPLTPEEWKIMKSHTISGEKLLSGNDSDLMTAGRIIARSHHERWDGNGYPDGITGEKIHIFARICALADVFDALVSDRPYKKAWPVEKAIATIKEGSGTQFDPNIVEAFLDVIDKAVKIQQEFKDHFE